MLTPKEKEKLKRELPKRFPILNRQQLALMTDNTVYGERNMSNKKPFRAGHLKAQAKGMAEKFKGYFVCYGIMRQFHPAVK